VRTRPAPFDAEPADADPLDTVLESISQGVYLLDASGRVTLYNQRLCELLELPSAFLDALPTLEELNAYQMQRGDFGNDAAWWTRTPATTCWQVAKRLCPATFCA